MWEGHLKPVAFRRFVLSDLPGCLQLYQLNEPGRFPTGVIEQYRPSLAEGRSYYLVSEQGGKIVASGGISYFMDHSFAVLCFGLVHPEHQGRGLGTALVLARLSLLDPKRPFYRVLIFAVEPSIGFYRRMGFREWTNWKDGNKHTHPSGHLILTFRQIRRCRRLLSEHGVSVPPDQDLVPVRTERGGSPSGENTQDQCSPQ